MRLIVISHRAILFPEEYYGDSLFYIFYIFEDVFN